MVAFGFTSAEIDLTDYEALNSLDLNFYSFATMKSHSYNFPEFHKNVKNEFYDDSDGYLVVFDPVTKVIVVEGKMLKGKSTVKIKEAKYYPAAFIFTKDDCVEVEFA